MVLYINKIKRHEIYVELFVLIHIENVSESSMCQCVHVVGHIYVFTVIEVLQWCRETKRGRSAMEAEDPSGGGVPAEDEPSEQPPAAPVAEKRSGCSHYKRRAKFVVSIIASRFPFTINTNSGPHHVHESFNLVSDRIIARARCVLAGLIPGAIQCSCV